MNIKKSIVIVSVFQLLACITSSAQVTLTYISGMDQPTGGYLTVGNDMWQAQGFRTGTNPFGYQLDSIKLLMGNASGAPSGFSVSLFNRNGVFPGDHLWDLEGSSNPVATGVYSYVNTEVTLLPSTSYFIVVTAEQALESGSFALSYMVDPSTYERVDNWGLTYGPNSTDGLAWERGSQTLQFDLSATAIVPEPSTYALFGGLAMLAFAMVRRNRRNE